ncbi:MAG: HepT-like ribonuclease domain-containing protein [Ilumatobacteraceae bacterium]
MLAHAYFHIDQDIIGHVINRDIPVLRNQLEAIADALGDEV